MTELEQQTEEIEALTSIYEGDTCFKQVSSTTFTYKYGEDNSDNSFMIEVVWGESYPNELPKISMDVYYNRNISEPIKLKIVDQLTKEGDNWIGCGMTYSLFECIKEQLPELQREIETDLKNASLAKATDDVKAIQLAPVITTQETPAAKKEQMTKSQKRRMWERTDNKGQRQRGWDWVDIIRHLSQTGQKEEDVPMLGAQLTPLNH